MDKDIDNFLDFCGITATNSTLKKIKHKIVFIDNYFQGSLNNLDLTKINKFLSDLNKKEWAVSTKNDTKKVLKRFLKWNYKDWNLRFNNFETIKALSNDQRKLEKSDLLSLDEMRIILNSIDSLKYKTILLLFQETACRPEELLKVKWKDVNLEKREIKLHSSKTDKTRYIPINESANHLKRYKTECFYQTPKIDDVIFGMSNQAVLNFLLKIERKLKFSKHLYPYLWRHSVLSRMIKTLSPKVYEMYSGHSLETGMKIYAHLDNDDVRKELNDKIYHIEELTKDKQEKLQKQIDKIKIILENSKNLHEVNVASINMLLDQKKNKT